MKIIIANDHKGTKLKNKLIDLLEKNGYEINNIGTNNESSVNYPDYAFKVGKSVAEKEADLGILICGTGIGMCIAANKVKGVRCALVHSPLEAKITREHNDANVLAIPSTLRFSLAKKVVMTFLETSFSNEQRHINRINMIKEYEEKND